MECPYSYPVKAVSSWAGDLRFGSLSSSKPMTDNEVLAEALDFVREDIRNGSVVPPVDESWYVYVMHDALKSSQEEGKL